MNKLQANTFNPGAASVGKASGLTANFTASGAKQAASATSLSTSGAKQAVSQAQGMDTFNRSAAAQQAMKDMYNNRINPAAAQFANAHGTKEALAKKLGELAKNQPKLENAKPNPFAGLPKFDPKWMQNGARTQSSTLSRLGLS